MTDNLLKLDQSEFDLKASTLLIELDEILKTPDYEMAEKLHAQISFLTPEDMLKRFTI